MAKTKSNAEVAAAAAVDNHNHHGDTNNMSRKSSKNNNNTTNKNRIIAFIHLKRSNFLNIALVLVISVLTNSIYFHLVYLPALQKIEERRPELPGPTTTSTITTQPPSTYLAALLAPIMRWSMFTSSTSLPPTTSSSSSPPRHVIKSFDHVAFPSLGDTGPSVVDAEAPFVGLLVDDSAATRKTTVGRQKESRMALKLALHMQSSGKPNKAAKIFKYALSLDPRNPDLLTAYGEYLERHKKDIVRAEHFYAKVVHLAPDNRDAHVNLRRAAPIVSKIDRDMLDALDALLRRFYDIPATNAALRRAKEDAYYAHIYHSNAIEGNTLNLQQTRHIIENRMAVGGKSVQEHNEVLGLDAAMRYINQTLLYKPLERFDIDDILQLHRRVLGFSDPIESGKFRKHQVL